MADVDKVIVDLLPDGVIAADPHGIVTLINDTAKTLLEQPGAAAGDKFGDVMALQDLDGNDWIACVQPYGGLQTRTRLLESAWLTASGREVLVTGRLHRPRPGGPISDIAVVIRDGRARQYVDRERSDLVATVAHELRSPLTGVKGFTSTLLSKWDRFTDSQKQLMLRTVDADADRLTRLIAELLDVARIDSGRLSVRKEPVEVADLIARQVEPLTTINGREIQFTSDGSPRVWVDRDKLSQIVANLVENAVKHGAGDVWVGVTALGDGGVELVVDDAGPGIPEDIRPRVFTKFWKHGKRGGSGLGLYIVGGLVAAHDGHVQVEQSPAGGARMRVVLPNGEPPIIADQS